jgi:hypothetical protein
VASTVVHVASHPKEESLIEREAIGPLSSCRMNFLETKEIQVTISFIVILKERKPYE